MATLAQIRAAVDADLSGLWSALQNRQDTLFASRGRYWQGKVTHRILPADGNATAPDNLADKPTNESQGWGAVLPGTLHGALQVDVYDGPAGPGYVATVTVVVLGTTYRRRAQVGPETWRAEPWAIIPTPGA